MTALLRSCRTWDDTASSRFPNLWVAAIAADFQSRPMSEDRAALTAGTRVANALVPLGPVARVIPRLRLRAQADQPPSRAAQILGIRKWLWGEYFESRPSGRYVLRREGVAHPALQSLVRCGSHLCYSGRPHLSGPYLSGAKERVPPAPHLTGSQSP